MNVLINKTLLFVIVIISIICTAHLHADENIKKAIISGHPEFPPIMYKHGNTVDGIGPEIITKIFNELGIRVENQYVGPWSRVQNSAKMGKIDLIAAIYKSKERESYLEYIPTFFIQNPCVVYVKKGQTFPFEKWNDLKGKTGGVLMADKFKPEFDHFLLDNQDSIKMIRSAAYSIDAIFNNLLNQHIDFLPYSKYVGLIKIKELNIQDQVEILPQPIYTGQFYFAFSKKSKLKKYIRQIDQKIIAYKKAGMIETLIGKHIDQYIKINNP
ncbi:MAG: transporter substrate-binding domain-containing protein [Desulfobacteraceae bacterium]|nr:transporter substrate-binding domain-containing protein [Desulfobacteraceae bacterium]